MNKLSAWLLTLALLGCLAAAQDASNRIAFITPDGQLGTVSPAGEDERVLSSGFQQLQFPAWAPDGDTVAVIGADAAGGFIQLIEDAANASPTEIYRSGSEPPFYLYWSPDGETVSFLANHPTEVIGLHLVSRMGEDTLLATGSPFYWQWQDDAGALFIHTGFSGPDARLGFTSTADDSLEANLAPPGRFQAPGISPSGKYLAYASINAARGPELVVQNNPETNPETLRRAVAHRGLVALGWSPVRDELAFMSPVRDLQTSFGPLQLLDAETGLLEPLSDNVAVAFFWSPDGRYIAYLSPAQQGDSDFARAPEGPLQVEWRAQQGPLPFNLYLIDVASRSEQLLGSFFPSPQFTRQFLPFFDQYALSHRVWSPGSDALVFPVIDLENPAVRVAVVTLDGEQRYVAQGDMPFWNRR